MDFRNRWILLRHGESQNNKQKVTSGVFKNDNLPLTKKGIAEIKDISKLFQSINITKIFTSPFRRAIETANIINKEYQTTVVLESRLKEIFMGDAEAISLDDPKHIEFYNIFTNFPDKIPLGGESQNRIRERVYNFFQEKERIFSEETILVVSHNIPIRCMIGSIYGLTWDKMRNNTIYSLKPGTAFDLNNFKVI